MIALIDYGAGNVRSVHKALETVGANVLLTRDPDALAQAEKVVLPGVGAFGDCMNSLQRAGFVPAIHRTVEAGTPFLGICVGLQVLFDEGQEMGCHKGLGLLPGQVVRFSFPGPSGTGAPGTVPLARQRAEASLKIPHTGWNQIEPCQDTPLLRGLPSGAWAYFNHAYHCLASPEHTLAVTDYGGSFVSVAGRENIYGIQFHPEKSQSIGLHILRNFVERVV